LRMRDIKVKNQKNNKWSATIKKKKIKVKNINKNFQNLTK